MSYWSGAVDTSEAAAKRLAFRGAGVFSMEPTPSRHCANEASVERVLYPIPTGGLVRVTVFRVVINSDDTASANPFETFNLADAVRPFWSVVESLLVATMLLGCDAKMVMATWNCPQKSKASFYGTTSASAAGDPDAGGADAIAAPFELPWNAGFETDFCEWEGSGAFCMIPDLRASRVVTDPVHSGDFAAEYTVDSTKANQSFQSRCVRRGMFPTAAYYGAWYFIPNLPNKIHLWNLFHFQGGDAQNQNYHDLWDVSIVKRDDGSLRLEFYDFGRSALPDQSNAPSIPIGAWFHIQLYVNRAADNTGEFVLYQDGSSILQLTGVVTDDTKLGQWYVGNYAEELDPVESTVYVDDVSISAAR
jgi:hypothetical protein